MVAAGEEGAGIYHEAIVAAARRACGSGELDAPDACVEVDNALCGDRVRMQVKVCDGRLSAVAHRVRGCLLCEAAASIIAANAIGETPEALARIQAGLSSALANSPANPLANPLADGFEHGQLGWQELEVFAPVGRHRSRHRCVTLAFEALARALAAVPAAPDSG